jgi:hypothetical protein
MKLAFAALSIASHFINFEMLKVPTTGNVCSPSARERKREAFEVDCRQLCD